MQQENSCYQQEVLPAVDPKRQSYQHIAYLKRKVAKLEEDKKKMVNIDKIFGANPGFLRVLKAQIARYREGPVRYSQFEKSLSLALYYSGGRHGYRSLLSLGLKLPKINTMQGWLGEFRFRPGFNQSIFDSIKKLTSEMAEKDRQCVLMWDEMSTKEWLEYNKVEDAFDGIVDHGELGRRLETSDEVLVFMVRSINSNWKFPLSFYFSKNATPSDILHKLVISNIKNLKAIGLRVRLCVCDMSFCNQGLYRALEVSPEQPFHYIGEDKIYFAHDSPHLFKLVRNNLQKHDYEITGFGEDYDGTIKWQHLTSFYKKDRRAVGRMAPKLTKAHIELKDFSKMKVKLATQLLSFSVYAGMNAMITTGILSEGMKSTALFVKMMDEMFDYLNISKYDQDTKPIRCSKNFYQNITKVDEYLKFLDCLEVSGTCRQYEFKSGLKLTLLGIKLLSLELKEEGFDQIKTRNLQQDPLENFFSAIRIKGGNSRNPTSHQFQVSFRCLFCCHLLIPSSAGNCETSSTEFYGELDSLEKIIPVRKRKKKPVTSASQLKPDKPPKTNTMSVSSLFYEKKLNQKLKLLNQQEDMVAVYVGGACLQNQLRRLKCSQCKLMSESYKDEYPLKVDNTLVAAKQFPGLTGSLIHLEESTANVFKYSSNLFMKFACKSLQTQGTNIIEGILQLFLKDEKVNEWLQKVATCKTHRLSIFKYFLRAKLYRLVKDKNENIRKTKSWDQNRREMRNQ